MVQRRCRHRIEWLLAAAITGSIYRSARTVGRLRRVVPLCTNSPRPPGPAAPVTAVVPARDEEAVIDACLTALRNQTYPARPAAGEPLRIVVVDDDSSDATADIAERHAGADRRVTVVRSTGPPVGWTGKVHALHAGATAAGPPQPGGWWLFLDADCVLAPNALEHLLATADAIGADLVSTAGGPPSQRSLTWPLLMPPALTLIGENASPDGRGAKAFAIGHCILLREQHYRAIGGWAALRSRRNEDIEMATAVRDHGGITRVVDALDAVTTTGMDPFGQGWASLRKSFVAATGRSVPVLIAGGIAHIAISLAAPAAVVVAVRQRRGALAAIGLAGWIAQSLAHWHSATLMRTHRWLAPAAPLTSALLGAILIDGGRSVLRGTATWKQRP
jgi:GT2 family glycosyltransferase